MFPYLIFISLAALAMGILNSLRAFAAPAFSPVFFNLFIIGCSLFLAPTMREPILGVAIGVVAGGAAQFAMQLPGLKLRGMLFGFTFNPGHPGVRKIGRLMIPSLLGLSVTQINITVSTILGSFLPGPPICFMACGSFSFRSAFLAWPWPRPSFLPYRHKRHEARWTNYARRSGSACA